MAEPVKDMWMVTVTYKDGTTQVFYAQDLDDFHWKMVPYITNKSTRSPMNAILIH